jgi:hypothetical protein
MLFIVLIFAILLVGFLIYNRSDKPAILDHLDGCEVYYNTTHAYVTTKTDKICFPHTPRSLGKIKKYKQRMGTD